MIPENIKQLANKVRNEIYGRDVRESIAQSMEVSGETSNEANERSKDTATRQTDVENRFDDQIAGNTDIDEVIDARRPEGGKSYPTLRKRLDDEHKEVTTQLAQIAYYIPSGSSADYIQNILNNAVDGSEIMLEKGGNYSLDKTIKFGLNQRRITINGNGSTVRFTHGGDGFDLESENYLFGSHRLLNMNIVGGNVDYPDANYNPTNTGAGVRLKKAYYTVLRDIRIQGFGTGLYIRTGIKNRVEGNTYILFNQIGIHIDGGASNANNFYGVSIRENRVRGVLIEGRPDMDSFYPSRNNFDGCLIESNTPYPYEYNEFPKNSVGVELKHTFDNYFTGTYSENHEVAIYIHDNSDGNYFGGTRFNQGGGGARLDKTVFEGTGLRNNTFENNQHHITSEPNVVLINAGLSNTRFINCVGLKLSKEDYENTGIDIINSRSTPGRTGERLSAPYIAQDSRLTNVAEGTKEGQISGIGTDKAIINARGYGEMTLGTLITGSTTIVDIEGIRVGQFFVLTNYQIDHPITIKNINGVGGLNLKDRKDIVLSDYNDTIVFYKNNIGRIVEVGRSIKDVNTQTGFLNIPANEETITVEHQLNAIPKFVSVTPNGNVGSVWVDTINSTSFTIRCDNPRTVGTTLYWLAEI